MTKLSLQFHADRIEVLAVVSHWAQQSRFTVVAESFRPVYQARLVDRTEIPADLNPVPDRISLSVRPVNLDVSTALEYMRKNPDVLAITFGDQSNGALRETFLGAMTDDSASLADWRRLRNDLRKLMFKGASVENVITGVRVRKEAHLYTAGAKRMAEAGVSILGPTDAIKYVLD
ncbi:hypothetical protein [Actinacidiphila yeochonensis]|uniref:hypothetical protein n=1 Tax=Actinacidiphila yeochonensis TaxID=89050 RepID=UPI0012FEC2D4|nr:hypothetical protein [Actinacidiphila yeochonensis]